MEAGGCACWADNSCDQDNLVPEGCDSCGEQAAVSCGITDEEDSKFLGFYPFELARN